MILHTVCLFFLDFRSLEARASSQPRAKLYYVAITLRDERVKKGVMTVAIAAAQANGFALQYASERMTNTESVVMAAVRTNGLALCHAHDMTVVLLFGCQAIPEHVLLNF